MPTTLSSCIWLDDRGVAWIDKTNIKVIEVAGEYLAHGNSPEEMCAQHPDTLTLGQIHSALGYYFDHQAELDAELERQYQDHLERLRAAQNSPARRKLRAMGLLTICGTGFCATASSDRWDGGSRFGIARQSFDAGRDGKQN